MARKKRKYIRHKPIRHDTVPLSSVIVGLLPILLMAGVVGGYIIYQYTDVFRNTTLPVLPSIAIGTPDIHLPGVTLPQLPWPVIRIPEIHLPEIHFPELQFPEVTISFDEVVQSLAAVGATVLDMLMTVSEQTVHVAGLAAAWCVLQVETGGMYVISGLFGVADFFRLTAVSAHTAIIDYFRTLGWTINDFFTYLDLPGKGQAALHAILWPLHFLDPRPAVHATGERVNEMNQAIAHALEPLWPIFAYLMRVFRETVDQLWQGITNLINLLNWLAQQSES